MRVWSLGCKGCGIGIYGVGCRRAPPPRGENDSDDSVVSAPVVVLPPISPEEAAIVDACSRLPATTLGVGNWSRFWSESDVTDGPGGARFYSSARVIVNFEGANDKSTLEGRMIVNLEGAYATELALCRRGHIGGRTARLVVSKYSSCVSFTPDVQYEPVVMILLFVN